MNVPKTRAVSVLTTIVLVAILTATAADPALAKKPDGKVKPKTGFTVNAMLFLYPWAASWEGDCNANGAINDRGDAEFGIRRLTLYGERGTIGFEISGDTFHVAWGSGAYAGLVATGSARVSETHGKDYRKLKISLRGTVLNGGP
jgi:hypothetical protein